jgi:hypothetical protein
MTEYPDRFQAPTDCDQLIPYLHSGKRVEVKTGYGEILRGFIGITSGWIPVFLLVRTKRSLGSIWTLDKNTVILKELSY